MALSHEKDIGPFISRTARNTKLGPVVRDMAKARPGAVAQILKQFKKYGAP